MKRLVCLVWIASYVLAAGPAGSEERGPFASTVAAPRLALDQIPMKVAIAVREREATVQAPSPFRVRRAFTEEVLFSRPFLLTQPLYARWMGFQFGDRQFLDEQLVFEADGPLEVNGRAFDGRVRVLKDPTGKSFTLVNEIPLEMYLEGVLPKEVDHRWNLEALKAQAVVSRTYALFNQLTRAGQPYALTSEELSQVYGGAGSRQARTHEAILATRGEVLTIDRQLFPTYFHASCGGHTTEAHTIWNILPVRPLGGVPCSFCRGARHELWHWRLSGGEIARRLRAAEYPVGDVTSILPIERDRSGRAQRVIVRSSGGQSILKANSFRLAVGPAELRSARFEVEADGENFVFRGRGWGHGAGLCQWGAKAQAGWGKTYREILSYYYPESELRRLP